MNTWGNALPQERALLLTTLFVVVCALLLQLMLTFERRKSARWAATAIGFSALLLLLTLLFDTGRLSGVPCRLLWAVNVLSAAGTAEEILYGARGRRSSVTKASIREAMDDLPLAGCYFTRRGNVKLCNRQMERLYRTMTGRDLQSLDELRAALQNCPQNGVERTYDGGYRFPDGKVWMYAEREAVAPDGGIYLEASFTDATDLSAINEELAQDNAELTRINGKLQKMYARAEDRVREREYLAFKMKIHDDIGRSLAAIRRVLSGETPDGGVEEQLSALSLAASTLIYTPHSGSDDPYDRLLNEAEELGVEVRLDGMLPMEPLIYDLVVQAARECVTNCVRHAHGSAVFVRILGQPGGYQVTITNDGERPRGEIREGGGLNNLRRSVENAGGEMSVSAYPAFALRLNLMREEMDL